MRLEDWREWPADRLDPLFERQRARWRSELAWDASELFGLVEAARAGGQLPGLLAVEDDGAIAGWCYASVQDGFLFIGALHGDRAEVVRLLLDAVVSAPEASFTRGYRCFVFPQSAAIAAALTRRRFEVQQFLYFQRAIDGSMITLPDAARVWRLDDLPGTARLLARAYAGTADGRCFAPAGRLEEWAAYLAQLVRTPACGTWAPGESFALAFDGQQASLDAVLLSTRLANETTHVAQVAVDPGVRGRGLASALVQAAAAQACAAGATTQTLLVAESNVAARRVYARLGFSQVACFLYAERPRISRVAPGPVDAAGQTVPALEEVR